nr:hypothetical protein BaRGS_008388 [Batillaria attramentaria]
MQSSVRTHNRTVRDKRTPVLYLTTIYDTVTRSSNHHHNGYNNNHANNNDNHANNNNDQANNKNNNHVNNNYANDNDDSSSLDHTNRDNNHIANNNGYPDVYNTIRIVTDSSSNRRRNKFFRCSHHVCSNDNASDA